VNGLPLSWNPGRNARGHGAEVVYATQSGVWVGSDTDYIGFNTYKHQKLAYFPFAGGNLPPATTSATEHRVRRRNASHCRQHQRAVPGQRRRRWHPVQRQRAGLGPDSDANPSPLHNPGSATALSGPVAHVAATVPSYVPKAIFDSERWDPGANGDGDEMTWTFRCRPPTT